RGHSDPGRARLQELAPSHVHPPHVPPHVPTGRLLTGERRVLGRCRQRATKYLARGWWQIRAEVVCSGWYWKPVSSDTSSPMRSPPSRSHTVTLSSRSGHAG